jgi:hypothetical protein
MRDELTEPGERARAALETMGLTHYGPGVLALAEQTASVCKQLQDQGFEFHPGADVESEEEREPFVAALREAVRQEPSPEVVHAVFECPGLWGVDEGGGSLMSICASLLDTLALELAWVFLGYPDRVDSGYVSELVAAERRAGVR